MGKKKTKKNAVRKTNQNTQNTNQNKIIEETAAKAESAETAGVEEIVETVESVVAAESGMEEVAEAEASVTKNIITVRDLYYNIGRESILEKVCLDIPEGSFAGMFGPDDGGKTSLLNVLMGFGKAVSRTIEVMGEDVSRLVSRKREGLKFLPDNILWESMSGRAYLDFCRKCTPGYQVELERRLIEEFELPLQIPLLSMTYNENKMVQIVGAICANPRLLILDEPCNFLSKASWRKLLDVLEELHSQGVTILVTADSYGLLEGYCDWRIYVQDGTVMYQGRVPEPDYRYKVVGAAGGNEEILLEHLDSKISVRNGRSYFLFKGNTGELLPLLEQAGCEDVTVEEMSLEEEIEEDYSRWE